MDFEASEPDSIHATSEDDDLFTEDDIFNALDASNKCSERSNYQDQSRDNVLRSKNAFLFATENGLLHFTQDQDYTSCTPVEGRPTVEFFFSILRLALEFILYYYYERF